MHGRAYHVAVLAACVFASLLVAVYPLPFAVSWLRPDLLVLVVIYWALHRAQHFSIGSAWLLGLLQDIVTGSVWGAHALALSVVVYICSKAWQRLRSYSVWQQTFWVFVFVGVHHVFVNWVQSFTGFSLPAHKMLGSVFTSAVCWPLLVLVLRRFHITVTGYR